MDHCRSQMLHDIEFDQNSTEDEQRMGTHLFRRLSHAASAFLVHANESISHQAHGQLVVKNENLEMPATTRYHGARRSYSRLTIEHSEINRRLPTNNLANVVLQPPFSCTSLKSSELLFCFHATAAI